jgi:transposase InsO family protein
MQYLNKFHKIPIKRAVGDLQRAIINDNETAKERYAVLKFFKTHGLGATLDAFNISKSTLYNWQKAYKDNAMRGLIPLPKRPLNTRQSAVPRKIEEFIINYRLLYPRVSQDTIKPALDTYCNDNDLCAISTATIGRLIKKLKTQGKISLRNKVRHSAKTGQLLQTHKHIRHKLRRKSYQPQAAGNLLQADSIKIRFNGEYKYLITAIDLTSRLAFVKATQTLSSINAKNFLNEVKACAPFKVERVQTDNGSEFDKHFAQYVKDNNIIHYHNYPRSPKSNAFIERFNRTLKEQFIYNNWDILGDKEQFDKQLKIYVNWYNNCKVHKGINFMTPSQYLKNHKSPICTDI